MKLLFQRHKEYSVWKSIKMQVKFIHIPNLVWHGQPPTINQQRYHKIQHLEPEIRHNPKKVRQMSFDCCKD